MKRVKTLVEQAFHIRLAERQDVDIIFNFIKALADYEKMSDEVVATPESLEKSLFDDKHAEVLIGERDGKAVGFALFFHNYSTFLGKAGIYLEDFFVLEDERAKGYGKALFQEVAKIAVARDCERMEWSCLDWNKPSIQFYESQGAVGMTDWTVHRLSGETLKKYGGDAYDTNY